MKNQTTNFYNRFVDEANLKKINDSSIQGKYWTYSLSILMFSIIVASLPTFIGYNFENAFAIVMFAWEMLMLFFLIYFFIRLISLDRTYAVFKKKYYAWLLPSFSILLSLFFAVLANFTATFTSNPDSSFSINFNPMFYFLIYLPLFFGYVIFSYYAYMKCFAKYVRSGPNKERTDLGQN